MGGGTPSNRRYSPSRRRTAHRTPPYPRQTPRQKPSPKKSRKAAATDRAAPAIPNTQPQPQATAPPAPPRSTAKSSTAQTAGNASHHRPGRAYVIPNPIYPASRSRVDRAHRSDDPETAKRVAELSLTTSPHNSNDKPPLRSLPHLVVVRQYSTSGPVLRLPNAALLIASVEPDEVNPAFGPSRADPGKKVSRNPSASRSTDRHSSSLSVRSPARRQSVASRPI